MKKPMPSETNTCCIFKHSQRLPYNAANETIQYEAQKPPFEVTCYGKLAKFEGTSLKPDASGKTSFGLKKLTKARVK